MDPLLITKSYIPAVRPGVVPRPRLIRRLQEGMGCKLTLISAPAGFGKTTLLSEWQAAKPLGKSIEPSKLQAGSCPVSISWVSLDENDNDPIRFWCYVITALKIAHPNLDDNVLFLLQSPQTPSIQCILTALINALASIKNDFALILDDYHVIDAQPIHSTLSFLLSHMPSQMHLVISSRTDPPLPLARLRARGELIELHIEDLRFPIDEAATFLNKTMDLGLSIEEVAVLAARTEGWVVGLQLAALSIRGRENISDFIAAFTGKHSYIAHYLLEEVLYLQPEDVQVFLLNTSILNSLTGSLCNAVTCQEGGQAMLKKLEQENLFIVPLDDEQHWYRYHHLFADMLRDRLQQLQPEKIYVLHSRASSWYEQHGLMSDAIKHALSAGDCNR